MKRSQANIGEMLTQDINSLTKPRSLYVNRALGCMKCVNNHNANIADNVDTVNNARQFMLKK